MSPAEGLVLATAAVLAAVAFLEGRKGALSSRVGVLLLALAMLAAFATVMGALARFTK